MSIHTVDMFERMTYCEVL